MRLEARFLSNSHATKMFLRLLIIVFAVLLTPVWINGRLLHDGRSTINGGGRSIPPAPATADDVRNLVLVLELALLKVALLKLVVLGAGLGRGWRGRGQRLHLAYVRAIVSVVVVLRPSVAVVPAATRRGVCGFELLLLRLLLMLLLLVLVVRVLVSHQILLHL